MTSKSTQDLLRILCGSEDDWDSMRDEKGLAMEVEASLKSPVPQHSAGVFLASGKDTPLATQHELLQRAGIDPLWTNVAIVLLHNMDTDPEVLQKASTMQWLDGHEQNAYRALASNPSLPLEVDTKASLVKLRDPKRYQELIAAGDPETIRSLEDGWRGSIRELLQAANLVNREAS